MAEQEGLVQGFKNFILRGNVVDLAVAVVIGTAFGAVVASIVKNIITPLIGAIFGSHDFSNGGIVTINNNSLRFGAVLTDLISFLAIAAVVYFLIVRPINKLLARFAAGEEVAGAPDPSLEMLTEIRDLLAASATR